MVLPPMMALERVRRCLPAAAAAREMRAGGRPSHRIQQMGRRQRPQASPKACLWHRLDSEPFVCQSDEPGCMSATAAEVAAACPHVPALPAGLPLDL